MNRRVIYLAMALACFTACVEGDRVVTSLNGRWELQVEDGSGWREVAVPGTFEVQVDVDFDGVAIYRRSIPAFPLQPGRRLIVRFDAVATQATVYFNGVELGKHTGGWTRFQFDVTELVQSQSTGIWEIKLRVDELVGHNTQGFLPIIAPHFGGFWQGARLIEVPQSWVDDTALLVQGDLNRRVVSCRLPVSSSADCVLDVSMREKGKDGWTSIGTSTIARADSQDSFNTTPLVSRVPDGFHVRAWTPADPALYELKFDLRNDESVDTIVQSFAFRSIQTSGDKFLLNDKPLNIRGLLNWGYAPPRTAPELDEEFIRGEIEYAKQCGFNLMKFCLWIPPKRYLELCDEMGMMAWIEYPAWHPDFGVEHLESLKREYDEFFFHDCNHPSVVLRSLTCETGPSADLQVIQSLYDQCKQRIPGAIVVDDSSWIAWNRVFDFYDDHPYGNNHTWVDELSRLTRYISEHGTKPLMLGEAITADTWTDPIWFDESSPGMPEYCHPGFLQSSRDWFADAIGRYGTSSERLMEDSKDYAMRMRKFQMETFRREVPGGGYVVSVIRDMPLAAMGLIDYRGRPKWTTDRWTWHGDKMLLLKTARDRRSFLSGDELNARVTEAGFVGPDVDNSFSASVHISDTGRKLKPIVSAEDQAGDPRVTRILDRRLPTVEEPARFELVAVSMTTDDGLHISSANAWPMWIMPRFSDQPKIQIHQSAAELVNQVSGFAEAFELVEFGEQPSPSHSTVVVSCQIDEAILDWLQQGGKVMLLASNQPHSFPLEAHWFLRGGPVISKACDRLFPHQMLLDLQHFDLAGDVIRNITYMNQIDPLMMLWEAHDLDHVQTNGLLFHMPVGEHGNLIVSALRHNGETNAAGSYVLQKLVRKLGEREFTDNLNDSLRGQSNLDRFRVELSERKIMLDQRDWRFRPADNGSGIAESWRLPTFDDSDWATIRIDRHWESQGYQELDHWACYRLEVNIPDDWDAEKTWLNFTGVDDYYDVYVNGERVGSGGDREKRETAFDQKASHEITHLIQASRKILVTVNVYDWQGAGGIFRPVWISTHPFSSTPRILK